MNVQKIIKSISLFILLCIILSSCPSPLTQESYEQAKDTSSPIINITSPEENEEYGAYTLISGIVSDETNDHSTGGIVSLSAITLGIPGSTNIPVNEDGSFSIIYKTNGAGYSSDIVLELSATDWNGNINAMSISLKKAAGDIAYFDAEAGNKKVVLDWTPLDGASGYFIEELRSGEVVYDITNPPYTWKYLENGSLYSFRLTAEIDGEHYVSSLKEVIPLSARTLSPDTESVYRGVHLSWEDIPAASEYVIERSIDLHGPYQTRTITADTSFTDTNLEKDSEYFYRIYPVEQMDSGNLIISDPGYGVPGFFNGTSASIVSGVDPGSSSWSVSISGNYAYLTNSIDDEGLFIIDISNPEVPVITGQCPTPGGPYETVAYGNYAYIMDGREGIQIVDISDKRNPQIISNFETPDDTRAITIKDNYAYVAIDNAGLLILDLANPASPVMAGSYDDTEAEDAEKITVDGNYAYVSGYGLKIYDISNPESPFPVGSCATPSGGEGFSYSDNYIYMADRTSGFLIIDVSEKTDPQIISTTATTDQVWDVELDGNRAYVSESYSGIQIFDITNKLSPAIIDTVDTPDCSYGMDLKGSYLYVADDYSGMQIIDITSPTAPVLTATESSAGVARNIDVYGNYAYIADGSAGLTIFDITNKNSPNIITTLATRDDAYAVDVCGDYAYVADDSEGLQIIDISLPSSPNIAASCKTFELARDVQVSGEYAFVTDYGSGMQIIDIADPFSPKIIASYDTDGNAAYEISIYNGHAYILDLFTGLHIIDISDISNPVYKGTTADPSRVDGFSVLGDYAYIADIDNGLQVYNFTDKTTPVPAGFTGYLGEAYSVEAVDDIVYYGHSGLKIYALSNPLSPALISSLSCSKLDGTAILGRYVYGAGSSEIKIINTWP